MAKREPSYSGNDTQWETMMEHAKSARHDLVVPPRPSMALTVLLHDVSTSMEGSKHRAACEAALQEMAMCDSAAHFIVGAFSHDVFFPSRVPMVASVASEAVRQLPVPNGGTALYRAVKEAAEIVEQILDEHAAEYDPRLAVIKVLTDGENTVEDGCEDAAREAVARLHARGCVVSLLQAGTDDTAATVLGVPEAAALYWTDDSQTLSAACLAACEATELYRRAASFASSSGTASPTISFGFTPLQRLKSINRSLALAPPEPMESQASSVQPTHPVPIALGHSTTFSR
ncbi:hypothetical protein AB1Y20_022364 [Prymnesium parvum]|uniref:VWFA domain-containing protein n=1 Tax=Prymnesium parvum TaxID=97485 RepID=A0AB34JJB4_PRYPA